MISASSDERLYRPCVGLTIFNRDGLVFLGERRTGPETGNTRHAWQMPQGGIDPGETPLEAAHRELYEETNIRSVVLLGEAEEWLCYDLPARIAGGAWKGRYRGQRQRWFAFRFDGNDSEIDVLRPGGGRHKAEFVAWRWERLDRVADLVIPFKKKVYRDVAAAFAQFAKPAPRSAGTDSNPVPV